MKSDARGQGDVARFARCSFPLCAGVYARGTGQVRTCNATASCPNLGAVAQKGGKPALEKHASTLFCHDCSNGPCVPYTTQDTDIFRSNTCRKCCQGNTAHVMKCSVSLRILQSQTSSILIRQNVTQIQHPNPENPVKRSASAVP